MKEQLISFETAKLAKEKGFNFPVLFAWIEILNKESSRFGETKCRQVNASQLFDNECYAPTQSLLQKWLREEHDIDININRDSSNVYHCTVYNKITCSNPMFDKVYEQALEKGLQEALNLIK